MIKTLVSHEGSSALIIDKPVLEFLQIDQNTMLEIVSDGESLIIAPVKDKSQISKADMSVKKYKKCFEKILKELAQLIDLK